MPMPPLPNGLKISYRDASSDPSVRTKRPLPHLKQFSADSSFSALQEGQSMVFGGSMKHTAGPQAFAKGGLAPDSLANSPSGSGIDGWTRKRRCRLGELSWIRGMPEPRGAN